MVLQSQWSPVELNVFNCLQDLRNSSVLCSFSYWWSGFHHVRVGNLVFHMFVSVCMSTVWCPVRETAHLLNWRLRTLADFPSLGGQVSVCASGVQFSMHMIFSGIIRKSLSCPRDFCEIHSSLLRQKVPWIWPCASLSNLFRHGPQRQKIVLIPLDAAEVMRLIWKWRFSAKVWQQI